MRQVEVLIRVGIVILDHAERSVRLEHKLIIDGQWRLHASIHGPMEHAAPVGAADPDRIRTGELCVLNDTLRAIAVLKARSDVAVPVRRKRARDRDRAARIETLEEKRISPT